LTIQRSTQPDEILEQDWSREDLNARGAFTTT
jgi:hypothetical protein